MHVSLGTGNLGHYERRVNEFACTYCGDVFETKATKAKYCPRCRELAMREYVEEKLAQAREVAQAWQTMRSWNGARYEVLCDPDARGGLAKGARFTESDMRATLLEGYWTPGTRFLDRKEGGELVVIGAVGYRQGLVVAEKINGGAK